MGQSAGNLVVGARAFFGRFPVTSHQETFFEEGICAARNFYIEW